MEVNTNKIACIISSLICIMALWARCIFSTDVSFHGRYYFAVIIGISGFMAVITLLRLLINRQGDVVPDNKINRKRTRQRRKNYRIAFDRSKGPLFMEETDSQRPDTAFTCTVIDISETGLGLDCTGVYTKGQTVLGKIIFDSGKTAPINGIVIREEAGGTFFSLHCTISPSLLMGEQREQIQSQKAKGPLPTVGKTFVDRGLKTLPSHRPKGICRLKQP